MSFLVLKSIPLSRKTRASLKEHGAVFFRDDRTVEEVNQMLPSLARSYEFLWNMGNSSADLDSPGSLPVYNLGGTVRQLLTPQVTRDLLGELMAPQTGETEYVWQKGYGRGGQNKYKLRTNETDFSRIRYWEDHVEGQEYRIVTVNGKIVQQFERSGDNARREYRWLQLQDLPRGAASTVREAAARLSYLRRDSEGSSITGNTGDGNGSTEETESMGSESGERPDNYNNSTSTVELEQNKHIISWDVCVSGDERAIIFEGNTSPGLNTHTARRIVEFIRNRELSGGNS